MSQACIDPTPRPSLHGGALADLDRQCNCVRIMRWTAVRTHSQAERWADANLRRLGFRTFLPMVTVLRRDRVVPSMWHSVQAPLFGSYLFVLHDPATSWGPIRDAPGVRSVLRCGNQIQYARAGAVEAVQAACELAAGLPRPRRLWAPGDAVRPRKGHVFEGHEAVVLKVGRDRVLVAMLLLGGLREVMIRPEQLEARDA